VELRWYVAADDVMTRLEGDPGLSKVLKAVRRTLGRMEVGPYDPRLRSRQFSTERYGQIRATPVGVGDWRIMWVIGPEADQITIAFITETSP
jgi:hypothetical protein